MKPRLVFVHGIGAPRDTAATLEEWLSALASGARDAGHSRRAQELLSGRVADARFAYYGDLFHTRGAQGTATPGSAEETLVAGLLLEAVEDRLAEPDLPAEEARALRQARAQLLPPEGTAQGTGNVGRRTVDALTSLLRVPGFRRSGGWLSARLTAAQLGQVARYLNRAEPDAEGTPLDQRIRQRLADCLDPARPAVVVAHSLGTVVAVETLHAHRTPVPLLVTLGSPLGLRTVVEPRIRPRPLRVPDGVCRWLNFWDRDDLVAARPHLEKTALPNAAGVLPETRRVDSDGVWVHPATKYLAQPWVAGPLIEALDVLART